jgi:hypothetical protein
MKTFPASWIVFTTSPSSPIPLSPGEIGILSIKPTVHGPNVLSSFDAHRDLPEEYFAMAPIQIPLDVITSRFTDRFNSVRAQSLGSRFSNLKPISEFLDLKRLSKPANFGEVQSRVNYNLSYFSSNYAVVFVMLSIYSLLTNWLLLFVIILITVGLYGIGKLEGRDLDVGVFRATSSQLYTGLLIVAVPLGIWASPLSTALWLIGATGVSVLGHAALMEKPIENAFSEEAV